MHIAIAGNIGSGKTTLATLLAQHLGCQAQYEDPGTNPYIEDFYRDMPRWAFQLQVVFLDQRLRNLLALQQTGRPVVQDRTLYEDAEIFAPNLLNMNLIAQRDYDAYRSLYQTLLELVAPPGLVVYLHAPITILVDQIARRGRQYEDAIRVEYLNRLNEAYEAWFDRYTLGPKMKIDLQEYPFLNDAHAARNVVQHIALTAEKLAG